MPLFKADSFQLNKTVFERRIKKIFPLLPVYASDRDWIGAQLLISWNYVTSPSLALLGRARKKLDNSIK